MSQNVTPLNKFSEDLTHWSYNGVELTLDIQDVETIERYEDHSRRRHRRKGPSERWQDIRQSVRTRMFATFHRLLRRNGHKDVREKDKPAK
jgi:hypothetical protein